MFVPLVSKSRFVASSFYSIICLPEPSHKSVILSPSTQSNWVITYENGASHYDVPFAWTSGINKQISLCRENFALELQQLQQLATAQMAAASRFASTAATMYSYNSGIF